MATDEQDDPENEGSTKKTTEGAARVSLVLEVGDLEGAAAGARMLTVDLRDDYPGPASKEVLRRLDAIAAMLALLQQRLRLLRLTLGGELDPRTLIADHNRITVEAGDDDIQDVLLTPRS